MGMSIYSTAKTWYLVANQTNAVIYKDSSARFNVVERLDNPLSKLKEGALDSDRPGRGCASAQGGFLRHGLDRHYKRREQLLQTFAAKIGKVLEKAQHEDRYTDLVVVAEPHFLGKLWAHLPVTVQARVSRALGKEYVRQPNAELRRLIFRALEEEAA
jgi:protein required for attachment to host cells